METKQCSRCKEVKQATEFYKRKATKDGLTPNCKKCHNFSKKEYYNNNKEKIREYYIKNRIKILENSKKYSYENREKKAKYRKNYKLKNKDKIREQKRAYYLKNKDKIKAKKNRYENREKIKKYHKKYRYENREKIKEYQREYERSRLKTDDFFKLKKRLRILIGNSFLNNGFSKKSRTHEILGCSFEEFKLHIERQFLKGMTWENRDKWHIDHIIPMATAKTEEDVIRLNHYTNLRPLWAEENLSKSDKIVTHQLVLL